MRRYGKRCKRFRHASDKNSSHIVIVLFQCHAISYIKIHVFERIICIEMQLTANDIQIVKDYFTGQPVIKAYVFGSFSRNEADKDQ